jgi:hypothetical protein
MALPQRKSEPESSDNRIYLVPPWAVKARKRSLREKLAEKLEESRFWDLVKFEAKILILVAVVGGLGFVSLKGLYRYKSESGVNAFEGVHGPNFLPFLR